MNANDSELKKLLKISGPVALSYLAGMSMQIVDTLFIARVSTEALAAVSLGNAVFSILFIFGLGIQSAFDFLMARDFGAKEYLKCKNWLAHGLVFSFVFSVLSALSMMLLAGPIMHLFGIDPAVAAQAVVYVRNMAWSLLPFLLLMPIRQLLQSHGVVTSMALVVIVANIVNAFANWVLVFGNLGFKPYGLIGSAWATDFARVVQLIVGIGVYYWHDGKDTFKTKGEWKTLHWKSFKELLTIGIPSGLQMLLEVGVFATSTMLAGKLGAIPIGAHQIVLQIASLSFMLPLGISTAASVLVGQAVGEKNGKLVVSRGWLAFKTSWVIMISVAFLLWAFANPLLRLFTHEQAIIEAGTSIMLIVAFFQFFDTSQVVGTGVLRGIGNTKISMISNLIGHWGFGLPIGYYLAFSRMQGLTGIWIGLCLGLMIVSLAIIFFWAKKSKSMS